MKNKRIFKTLSALCAALVLMGGFSVTAFAQGAEQPPAEDATNDEDVVVEETEDSPALTPEGNAALVDDFGGNKQLITVTTKAGNYFYILIARANEDKETAVHFLNQVDEADLEALMEDGETAEETPAVCNCTEKCAAGAVNTACPVCAVNMAECTGQEPEPTPDPDTEPEPEQEPAGLNPAMLLVVLAVLGGIGAQPVGHPLNARFREGAPVDHRRSDSLGAGGFEVGRVGRSNFRSGRFDFARHLFQTAILCFACQSGQCAGGGFRFRAHRLQRLLHHIGCHRLTHRVPSGKSSIVCQNTLILKYNSFAPVANRRNGNLGQS